MWSAEERCACSERSIILATAMIVLRRWAPVEQCHSKSMMMMMMIDRCEFQCAAEACVCACEV